MRKLIQKKHEDGENGIAIMFSLIMLMIFFLIAFGFVSMASSSRDAALAREPAQQASLSANESILNEVFVAMETSLISNDIVDFSKMKSYVFDNSANSNEVTVQMWGTSGGNTNLEANLPLQVLNADDFDPDTNTTNNPEYSNFGWVTGQDLNNDGDNDRYAWMVIDSNGIDPNYVGGKSGGVVTGIRKGEYIRELDIGVIEPSYRDGAAESVYVDWSAGSPAPWEDKKSLINSLSASVVETAVSIFEPNSSPVQIGEMKTSRYDLSNDPSSDSLASFISSIAWLNNSSSGDKNQVGANLKDFIDQDNIATSDSGVVGNERVPYINEIRIQVTNATVAGTAATPTASQLAITMTPEFYNMYDSVSSWDEGHGGSPDGSTARVTVAFTVKGTRTGADINTSGSVDIDFDLSSHTATGVISDTSLTGSTTVTSATKADEPVAVDDVEIQIDSITLYGDAGTSLWDLASPNASTGTTTILTVGPNAYHSVEVANPRDNQGSAGWAESPKGWTTLPTTTGTIGAMNDNFAAPGDEGESGNPETWSTAWMPPAGKINHLSELGMCVRTGGKTLNLVDYNAKNPTRMGNYEPSGTLTMGNANTFDGGDRSLLDYVMITAPGTKTPTGGSIPSYQQFGAVNPNTSNTSIIKLLLNGVSPLVGPASGTPAADAILTNIANNFPGVEASTTNSEYFHFDQFKDSDNRHNRNPTMYGYPFSSKHSSPAAGMSDALKEALVLQSMNLVSPKYSYFTILIAVDLLDGGGASLGSPSKIRAFVRRDNESGSYKIMKKSEL